MAVAYLLTGAGIKDDEQFTTITRMFTLRCSPKHYPDPYTLEELRVLLHRLPFDPRTNVVYGRAFSLADCERIVLESRAERARFRAPLTEMDKAELKMKYNLPDTAFTLAAYDERNNKIFKFKSA